LSLITNIGHDHMDLLGDTLEKIAEEKAGIIKSSVPVIISESQSKTGDVFRSVARENGSRIIFADQLFRCNLEEYDSSGTERIYSVEDVAGGKVISGKTPLAGDYQSKNIQALFCAVMELRSHFKIADRDIINGIRNTIRNTGLAGRWHVLKSEPLTICDTAHNREGLEIVLSQISRLRKKHLHIVLGFVNDKDIDSVLPLFPVDATYYFTKASIPRALDHEKLKHAAERYKLRGDSFVDVSSAVKAASDKAAPDDVIFIGGSTFVVAEVV
jgi:dihydrofolate synthase / folylpolyglutamate synthase